MRNESGKYQKGVQMNDTEKAQQMITLPSKIDGTWFVECLNGVRWVKQEFDSCESAWAYYYTKLKDLRNKIKEQGKAR